MRYARHTLLTVLLVVPGLAVAQDAGQPTNDAPNHYTTIKDYFKLPEGRTWGSTSAVDIDKDGKSIWVAERCGQNSCLDRATGQMNQSPTVLKFDSTGKRTKAASALCCASDLTVDQFKSLKGKMDASNPNARTPEEFLGGTANWRTDLYSTGGTLHLGHRVPERDVGREVERQGDRWELRGLGR